MRKPKKDPILVKLERQLKYHTTRMLSNPIGSSIAKKSAIQVFKREQRIQGYKNWGDVGLNAPAVWDEIKNGNKSHGTWEDEEYTLVTIDGQWFAVRNGEMRLATVDADGNITNIDEDSEVLYAEY